MEFKHFASKCVAILPDIEESSSCQKKKFLLCFRTYKGENCVSLVDLCDSGKLQPCWYDWKCLGSRRMVEGEVGEIDKPKLCRTFGGKRLTFI